MILISSPKGGVGVTAVAAELARHLGQRGRDVVAVDLTDQGALGYRVGAVRDAIDEAAQPISPGGFRQVDGHVARGSARAQFALAQRRPGAILVVDVAAGDRDTRDALSPHADLALCVLAADAGSLAVLPQAAMLRGDMPYCVLNLVDERRALSADAVTIIGRVFGPKLLGIIRQDEAVNEALAMLAEVAPGAAAGDFAALAARIDGLLAANASTPIEDVA